VGRGPRRRWSYTLRVACERQSGKRWADGSDTVCEGVCADDEADVGRFLRSVDLEFDLFVAQDDRLQ